MDEGANVYERLEYEFVNSVNHCGLGISSGNCHLFILDGYGSCMTINIVKMNCSMGLDLFTLLPCTFHVMQPLDVSNFKPFKQEFSLLRDVWTLRNKS